MPIPTSRANTLRVVNELRQAGTHPTTQAIYETYGLTSAKGRKIISNNLSASIRSGHLISRHAAGLRHVVYSLTKDGRAALDEAMPSTQSPQEYVDYLNASKTNASTTPKRKAPTITPAPAPIDYGNEAKQAIESIASLVDENARLRDVIRKIMAQCERVIENTNKDID